ncbi:MAG: FHA domain-containing protein [Acidobacteria bacterium]|nr:FHA domain-containing protein [Acidobacteriota bacterium]
MTKLTLKFEERVLREILMGPQVVKIGRLPDNTVVIDNPAVSGHHARIFRESNNYVLEDLGSTNGTFVNERRVTRHMLANSDVIQVGKHRLLFEQAGAEEPVPAEEAAPSPVEQMIPELGGTVFLDTKAQRELLAKQMAEAQAAKGVPAAVAAAAPAAPAAPPKLGVLTVLAGRTDQSEYTLQAHTSLIGKSETATVRLKGWFKPKVAAAIARKGDGYVLTPVAGKVMLNNQPLRERHELREGDVLQVSGLTLQFNLKS